MSKFKKFTLLASLFLGATVLGSMSASATPLASVATGVKTEIVDNKFVHKTGKKTRNLLLGLGLGAVAGGLIVNQHNQQRNSGYYAPPPQPVYRGRYQPWSAAWHDDCARRYRSFNHRTGYFQSYRHGAQFCY